MESKQASALTLLFCNVCGTTILAGGVACHFHFVRKNRGTRKAKDRPRNSDFSVRPSNLLIALGHGIGESNVTRFQIELGF